jgi:acyl-CoA oxidase-like protein
VAPDIRSSDPAALGRLLDGRYAAPGCPERHGGRGDPGAKVAGFETIFMEHGRLAGPRCKAITRDVNRLCDEVRQCAGRLVDAFGIPDEVLGAPIGLADAAAAQR